MSRIPVPLFVARNRALWLILLAAFTIRFLLLVSLHPWDGGLDNGRIYANDAGFYHILAQCIVNKFTFCGDTFRTPGYPAFMALFYYLFGAKPWIVLFVQIFVDLVTIYFIAKIGGMLFSRRAGAIAALFLAVDPTAIFTAPDLLSDGLFVAVLAATLYFYLRGVRDFKHFASFAVAGLLCGAAVLVRPVAQYYAVVLAVFALLWPREKIVSRLKCVFVYGLFLALTVAPWMYRNYSLYGVAKVSSVQGDNLLFWQVTYARAAETGRSADAIAAEFAEQAKSSGYDPGGNPFVNEAITQKIAVQYIKGHPLLYATCWLSGIIHTFANLNTNAIAVKLGLAPVSPGMGESFFRGNELDLVNKFVNTKSAAEMAIGVLVLAMLLTNYATALLGAVVLIKRGQLVIVALFAVSALYFAVTAGVIGLARFRMPIAPFYLLIGAAYVDLLLDRTKWWPGKLRNASTPD